MGYGCLVSLEIIVQTYDVLGDFLHGLTGKASTTFPLLLHSSGIMW